MEKHHPTLRKCIAEGESGPVFFIGNAFKKGHNWQQNATSDSYIISYEVGWNQQLVNRSVIVFIFQLDDWICISHPNVLEPKMVKRMGPTGVTPVTPNLWRRDLWTKDCLLQVPGEIEFACACSWMLNLIGIPMMESWRYWYWYIYIYVDILNF